MMSTILGHNESAKEQLDNQQNAETQRERYYATIHKVSLQSGEKIPGILMRIKARSNTESIICRNFRRYIAIRHVSVIRTKYITAKYNVT